MVMQSWQKKQKQNKNILLGVVGKFIFYLHCKERI